MYLEGYEAELPDHENGVYTAYNPDYKYGQRYCQSKYHHNRCETLHFAQMIQYDEYYYCSRGCIRGN